MNAVNPLPEAASRLCHDLRSPLQTIQGFAELLLETRLDDQQARFVRHIARECAYMLTLSNSVLATCRLEAGALPLCLEHVALHDLFREIAEGLERRAKASGIALLVTRERTHVLADRAKLKQILLNLAENALKFTPTGGRVWLDAVRHGDVVLVSVSDTGVGIPPQDTNAIFEAFHQCGGPNEVANGVGLGLAIVKGLVEQHGGQIWVESQPGLGSKFLFTLPPAPAPQVKRRREAPALAELAVAG